jgi:hypothetical protein
MPNGGYPNGGNGNGNGNGGGFVDPTGGWVTDYPNGNGGNGGGVPVPDPWYSAAPEGDQGVGYGPNALAGDGWYAHPNAGRQTFKQRKWQKMLGKNKRPLTLGAKQAYRRDQGWYY